MASYSELHAADLATTLLDLPQQRLIEVAEELPDERLADALEEMPEDDQVGILDRLGDERAADVLDEMEPDDAADLLAQMPPERLEQLLALMEPEEADDVRTLLRYGPDTAGGLMTTEPIILSADATVAEALALIRRHELHPALAAAVFVTLPPFETPTGRLLGVVHFQRMLRYPPHERLGAILDDSLEPVSVTASATEVARMLASYDLVSLPVVDAAHRASSGAISVDGDGASNTCCPTTGATDAETTDAKAPQARTSGGAADAGAPDSRHARRKRAVVPDDDGPARSPRHPAAAVRVPAPSRDRFGRFTEWVARAMGTPAFLVILTLFCAAWIVWNTLMPDALRFDSAALGFTALTLILSLQASYAAPMILLAQNRQDDRDRVQIEQDRQRAERNLADTEYLAREIVAAPGAGGNSSQAVSRDVLRQGSEGAAGRARRRAE